MTDLRLIYVTTPDADEARAIANELVKQRLIACANILPGMQSIYRWKGKLESTTECVLLLKTTAALVEPVITALEGLHSYDVPCAMTLAVESGAEKYLGWLKSEVTSSRAVKPPAKPAKKKA